MPELPKELFRRWQHSFEEDSGGVNVYRPTEYNFPRARGRAGIEFSPDGRFTEYRIGPADRQQPEAGHWSMLASGKLQMTLAKEGHPSRTVEIVESGQGVLKLRSVAV